MNLISNALRHTAAKSKILVSAWREGNTIMIEVKDNGPGIDEEMQKHLFEPYYRIEKSVDRLGDGVRAEESQFESAIDERVGHLEPVVIEESEEFDAAIDDRVGHVEPEGEMPRTARLQRGRAPFFGRPTASELQHAVLMREVLGPPVAFRPPTDER